SEDVDVPEPGGALLLRRRHGRRRTSLEGHAVRIDSRTVGGVTSVVPDPRAIAVRRYRVHVVAQELVRQRVGARSASVTGHASVQLRERTDCPVGLDVSVLDNSDELAWL